jgi:hypothetical protein
MTCKPPEIPLKQRWLLYAGAWGAVFLGFFMAALKNAFVAHSADAFIPLLFFFLFPSGLAAWFNHSRPLDDIGLLAVLWLAYLVHGVFALRSRTRVRFYILLSILAIVLAFNVVGCHRIELHFG